MPPTSTRSPHASAARSWSRRCAAATTAAVCCWPAISTRRARRRGPATWPRASPVLVEERVTMRRELAALVARSPFGQGAAWPIVETVQRDGICVEVHRARAGSRSDDTRQCCRGSWRCGWPTNSAWSACWRSSCSRPSTAPWWSTSWRCDRTTPVTGPWTASTHQSVRAASARGARLSARRHRLRSRR